MVGIQNFQDTLETRKRSFISAFSISLTVPLRNELIKLPVKSFPMTKSQMSLLCLIFGHFMSPIKCNYNVQHLSKHGSGK